MLHHEQFRTTEFSQGVSGNKIACKRGRKYMDERVKDKIIYNASW